MISRTKKKLNKPFSVIDIETGKEGNLLAICSYDGESIKRFGSWGEYLQFLFDYNDYAQYQSVFAHYGGGFDYVHMLENGLWEMQDVKVITSGSDIIMIHLLDYRKPVVFADSIKVLLSGLKKLGETFQVQDQKKEIDINRIEEIFNDEPEIFWEYLESDCISLYQIMVKFMELLEIEFFPVTAASLAMRIFKERFIPEGVNLFKPSLKPESDLDKWLSRSYAGGRVECFQGGSHQLINVYDINSLYPSVMLDAEIPDCCGINTNSYIPEHIGFYEVEFEQLDKTLPPVLWIKTHETGLEFVYKGEGVFCSIEIDKALEIGVTIKVIKGYFYPRTAKVFFDYVTTHYNLRLENKDKPLDHICKLLLNSLYGKFAQKEVSTSLQKLPSEKLQQLIIDGIEVTPYDEEKELYLVGEVREIGHRLIHVASIITALARIRLYNFLQRYKDNLVYCDTDSVHLTCEMESHELGKELGKMKLEDSGAAVYIGRKMYAVSKKLKFKGINTKDRLAEDFAYILTSKDLERIWEGESVEFIYHTFPKLKTVLKGAKAAKKMRVKKDLTKGKYFSHFKE